MTEDEKDKAKAATVAGAGASVGGAGGATVGVLELAAKGAVTGLSAGLVIGLGAAAGSMLAYGVYRFFRKPKKTASETSSNNKGTEKTAPAFTSDMAEHPADKLKNITPLPIINPAYVDGLESGAIELRTEMEKEWEKDWSDL